MDITQPLGSLRSQSLAFQRLGSVSHREQGTTFLRRYLLLHACFFCLYALLGKGFAYAGLGQLFVGEMLFALAAVALFMTRRVSLLLSQPLAWLMLSFAVWQAICTVPYIDVFGVNAVRDGALWGYSLFAWVVAALLLRLDGSINEIIQKYRRFAGLFIFTGPVALMIGSWSEYLPSWPGTNVAVLTLKAGDTCVHLAGVIAFVLAGVSTDCFWWIVPALTGAFFAGVINRGGLVSFLAASLFVIIVQPRAKQLFALSAAVGAAAMLLYAVDPHVVIPGSTREISAQQIIYNVESSLPGGADAADLDGTRKWRLLWWNKILDDTVFGPYFWTGKGYGINLAVSDGIDTITDVEQSLRSPHNSHLTFLARSGVPGFLLWVALQVTWFGLMLSAHLRARAQNWRRWSAFFLWTLAYWTAFTVNAFFDVSFEGPVNGIPFWTIFGLGWGGQIIFVTMTKQALAASTAVVQHTRLEIQNGFSPGVVR